MTNITHRAQIALDTLEPNERATVECVIKSLEGTPEGTLPVQKLAVPGAVFLTSAGQRLRLIFEVSNGTKTVLDVFDRDRLANFHRGLDATEQP